MFFVALINALTALCDELEALLKNGLGRSGVHPFP
jgi:hypothetical protein